MDEDDDFFEAPAQDPWMQVVELVQSQPDWDEEEADGPADIVEYIANALAERHRQ